MGSALLAGALAAMALPPIGAFPAVLLAWALFLRALAKDERGWRIGFAFGVTAAFGSAPWILLIFGPVGVPLLLYLGGYAAVFGGLTTAARRFGPWGQALAAAVFAVGLEWLRAEPQPLRFPWFAPAHALAAWAPAISSVRFLGVYGLSFVITLIAALGAFRHPALWLAFLLLPLPYHLPREADGAPGKVLLIQAEGDCAVEDVVATIGRPSVDLVIQPENAYHGSPKEALARPLGPQSLALRLAAPVLFGASEPIPGAGAAANAAIMLSAEGAILGSYHKQRLVPLLEKARPGRDSRIFALAGGTVGVGICYDFDAPTVAAEASSLGATVLALPTLDQMAWSAMQHRQHELLVRLRAVENDRYVLRAASSGRSEVIDPRGVPSATGIEIGERGFVVLPFAHRNSSPFGPRLRFLGPVAAALSAVFVAIQFARRRA